MRQQTSHKAAVLKSSSPSCYTSFGRGGSSLLPWPFSSCGKQASLVWGHRGRFFWRLPPLLYTTYSYHCFLICLQMCTYTELPNIQTDDHCQEIMFATKTARNTIIVFVLAYNFASTLPLLVYLLGFP